MNRLAAIYSESSQFVVDRFYGFIPEEWGFLGFTREAPDRTVYAGNKPATR
jgi:hypothetical protein